MDRGTATADYIMEDPREASRLARKVNPDAWMKKYLQPHFFSGAEVLSVGCGPGNIIQAITKAHPKVNATGIDLSVNFCRHMTKRLGDI